MEKGVGFLFVLLLCLFFIMGTHPSGAVESQCTQDDCPGMEGGRCPPGTDCGGGGPVVRPCPSVVTSGERRCCSQDGTWWCSIEYAATPGVAFQTICTGTRWDVNALLASDKVDTLCGNQGESPMWPVFKAELLQSGAVVRSGYNSALCRFEGPSAGANCGPIGNDFSRGMIFSNVTPGTYTPKATMMKSIMFNHNAGASHSISAPASMKLVSADVGPSPLGASEICNDLVDNDCDGIADCVDSDCASNPFCAICDQDGDQHQKWSCGGNDCNDNNPNVYGDPNPKFENTAGLCSDGEDNDCNGNKDCKDARCRSSFPSLCCAANEIACRDAIDDDCDGRTDCDDTQCASSSFCDGCDMDLDGWAKTSCGGTDCNDNNPAVHPGATEICGDGIDQNCDGSDSPCTGGKKRVGGTLAGVEGTNWNTVSQTTSVPQCSSGVPDDQCNTGVGGACKDQGVQAGFSGTYGGKNWLCGMSSGAADYVVNVLHDTIDPKAFFKCDANNVGGPQFSVRGRLYCCRRDNTTCESTPKYEFVEGECNAGPFGACKSSYGLTPGCDCPAAGVTNFTGGPSGGPYGTDWSTRIATGTQTTSCAANQCAHPTGGNSCYSQNSLLTNSRWACVDNGAGLASYYCSWQNQNKTITNAGQPAFCCQDRGTGFQFYAGVCVELCSDGKDNDGDGLTDAQDSDCGGVCGPGNTPFAYAGGPAAGPYDAWTSAPTSLGDGGNAVCCAQLTTCKLGNSCVPLGTPGAAGNVLICGQFGSHPAARYQCTAGHVGQVFPGSTGSTSRCCTNSLSWEAMPHADCAGVVVCNRNGVQDNGETGVDCGGGGCAACACTSAAQCEDFNSCTTDTCVSNACQHAPKSGSCPAPQCHIGFCSNGFCQQSPSSGSSCGVNQVCDAGVCINCDRDFDTYRAAHSPFCSQPTNDCRDVNGFDDPNINPGMNESGFCQDGKDNNCNSEADYDGFTSGTINPAVHGDSACPVSIVGMSAPATVNTAAACSGGATVAVTCTTNVGNIRSVLATLGSSGCAFTGWSGTTASFTCARPATDGAYTARCTVNGAQSYQFGADQTRQVVVDCARNVSGKVTDASSGNGIASATVRVTDTAQQATSQSDGSYKIVDVPVGTHNLTATASSGFYMGKVFGRLVSAEPTVVNFPLDPWQCTSNCTFGEQDFCDYRCMQAGTECTFTGVAAQDKQRFIDTCREAPKGSLREFNASHVANCCLGPIAPKENYKTPLTIQSCARELIPHTTLVNYNGRIHRLTVLSYRECEE